MFDCSFNVSRTVSVMMLGFMSQIASLQMFLIIGGSLNVLYCSSTRDLTSFSVSCPLGHTPHVKETWAKENCISVKWSYRNYEFMCWVEREMLQAGASIQRTIDRCKDTGGQLHNIYHFDIFVYFMLKVEVYKEFLINISVLWGVPHRVKT